MWKKGLYFLKILCIIQEKSRNTRFFGKEGYCYMERRIKLTPDEVKHFVAVTSKCDFDIDISYNRYVVDAKSFLGVYGLDFTKVLTVHYDGYDEELEKLLTNLAIAC